MDLATLEIWIVALFLLQVATIVLGVLALASKPRSGLLTVEDERARMRLRGPDKFPPGTVPVELARQVRERWRALGYDGSEARVLRLVSAAHRVMCEFEPSEELVHYNDGDRAVPAQVACVAEGTRRRCTFPDCECEAIPPPAPPTDEPFTLR